MKRAVAIMLLLALTACSSRPQSPPAEPEELPAAAMPDDSADSMIGVLWGEISFWKRRTKTDPYDFIAWRNVATRALTLARAMGGDAWYVEAAAAAAESLRLQPKHNAEGVACLAMAKMGAHDFRGALELLDGAIAASPDEAWLFGVRGDAWFGLGEYEKAGADYRVMHKSAPGFASLSRMAALNWVLGDSSGSLALYRKAVEQSAGTGTEPQAWVRMMLGSRLLALGRLGDARRQFADTLRIAPDYREGMLYLAKTLELEGRHEDARPYFETALKIQREPALMRRLATVEELAGNNDAARKLLEQAERLETGYVLMLEEECPQARLRERAELLMDRAEQLDCALECARRDLELRRDLESCRVMARALRLNGRAAEALPYVEEMLRYRTTEPTLWDEAEAVYETAGSK